MVRKTILSFVSALLLTGCAQGTPKRDSTELDTLLRAAVESRQAPAVAAMVATKEGIVYEGAVGVPMDAIFAIASMTKPVTSVAVMQLVEAGKVQLDEPAHTYLPELRAVQVLEGGVRRPPTSPPTVRHLLTHTSGFAYGAARWSGCVRARIRAESQAAGVGARRRYHVVGRRI